MKDLNVLGALPYEQVRDDCHTLKTGITSRNPTMVRCAGRITQRLDFQNCIIILVPVPSHHGPAIDTQQLATAIAEEINRKGAAFAIVGDILTCEPHESLCEAKRSGKAPETIPITVNVKNTRTSALISAAPHIPVYLVDNVVDTGRTARACMDALPTAAGVIAVGDTGRHTETQ